MGAALTKNAPGHACPLLGVNSAHEDATPLGRIDSEHRTESIGTRITGGGRTVKNVQGYDLTRLFVGSFGALGHAETLTLRLRPGLSSAHHSRTGTLQEVQDSRARFLWQDGETLHAYHFGHEREVWSVMTDFGGAPHGMALFATLAARL